MNDLYVAAEIERRDLTIARLRARIAELEAELLKAQLSEANFLLDDPSNLEWERRRLQYMDRWYPSLEQE